MLGAGGRRARARGVGQGAPPPRRCPRCQESQIGPNAGMPRRSSSWTSRTSSPCCSRRTPPPRRSRGMRRGRAHEVGLPALAWCPRSTRRAAPPRPRRRARRRRSPAATVDQTSRAGTRSARICPRHGPMPLPVTTYTTRSYSPRDPRHRCRHRPAAHPDVRRRIVDEAAGPVAGARDEQPVAGPARVVTVAKACHSRSGLRLMPTADEYAGRTPSSKWTMAACDEGAHRHRHAPQPQPRRRDAGASEQRPECQSEPRRPAPSTVRAVSDPEERDRRPAAPAVGLLEHVVGAAAHHRRRAATTTTTASATSTRSTRVAA